MCSPTFPQIQVIFIQLEIAEGKGEERALRRFWHEFGLSVSSFQQCVVTDDTLSLVEDKTRAGLLPSPPPLNFQQ